MESVESDRMDFEAANMGNPEPATLEPSSEPATTPDADAKAADPFDEIDFGSYFDDYLDPGYKSPASENVEKPSFETFLSSPVTLTDHLRSQLALVSLTEEVRDAAESIIGNLNENGYLMTTAGEIATSEGHKLEDVLEALRVVHTLDPAGVGCADVRECLLLQIDSRNGKGGVAWQIVHDHLKLVELRQIKGAGARAAPADRAYPDCSGRDPAFGSSPGACGIRARMRASSNPMSIYRRTAKIT